MIGLFFLFILILSSTLLQNQRQKWRNSGHLLVKFENKFQYKIDVDNKFLEKEQKLDLKMGLTFIKQTQNKIEFYFHCKYTTIMIHYQILPLPSIYNIIQNKNKSMRPVNNKKLQQYENQMRIFISQKKTDKEFMFGRAFKRLARKLKKAPQQFLKDFQNLQAECFYLSHINLANSLDVISNIKFINPLIKIQLYQSNLHSIEQLSQINCSNLKMLCLSRNKIVSLKMLRKVYAPHLQRLAVDKNYIQDIGETLPECTWIHSIKNIQIESYPESQTQSETINWFAKLIPATSDLSLLIRSPNRIQQKLIQFIRTPQAKMGQKKIFDKKIMGYLVSDGESEFSSNDS